MWLLSFKNKKHTHTKKEIWRQKHCMKTEIRVMLWRSQGTPEITSKPPESITETWNRQTLTGLRNSNPADTHLGVPASRTIRNTFLILFISHSTYGIFCFLIAAQTKTTSVSLLPSPGTNILAGIFIL